VSFHDTKYQIISTVNGLIVFIDVLFIYLFILLFIYLFIYLFIVIVPACPSSVTQFTMVMRFIKNLYTFGEFSNLKNDISAELKRDIMLPN